MPLSFKRIVTILPVLTSLTVYVLGTFAIASAADTAPSEEHPVVVHVGVVIRNIVAVDEVKENWQVTGLLVAKWADPNRRFRPVGRGRLYRDLPATNWKPSFEFVNEDKATDFRFVDLYAQPDGTIVYTQSFNTTLASDFDLRRFPFDSQRLPLVIQARGDDLDRTVLVVDTENLPLPKAAYAGLAQWQPVSLTERLGTVPGSASNASDVEVRLKVQRSPKPYILKFIIPLLLLVIISWVTFWLSHEEFKTKDQLGSAVSTLLIIVAFNITATTLLPKTEYITYIDALLFSSFVFVIISIATVVGTHLLQMRRSEHRALRVRRLAGVVLPVAFLITQAVLLWAFHIAG